MYLLLHVYFYVDVLFYSYLYLLELLLSKASDLYIHILKGLYKCLVLQTFIRIYNTLIG